MKKNPITLIMAINKVAKIMISLNFMLIKTFNIGYVFFAISVCQIGSTVNKIVTIPIDKKDEITNKEIIKTLSSMLAEIRNTPNMDPFYGAPVALVVLAKMNLLAWG